MIQELNKVSFKKILMLFSLITIGASLVYFTFPFMPSATADSVLVDKIEQSDGWGVITVDPYTFKVYVTNFKSTTVTVIDGTTNKPLSVIEVGKTPYGIGINTDTKMLYVALEYNDTLAIINTTTGEIIKNIDLVDPYDIAVNSKTNKVYVTSDKTNLVSLVDGSTNEIISTFDVQKPCGIAVNEATNMVYVTSESTNKVHVIDGSKNNLVTTIDVGKSPRGVVVNPNTNMVYVTNQLSGTVDVIDGYKNEIIDTISVGNTPRRIVVNPDTNIIYVSNQISNSLSVIDGETNEVIDSIPVEQPFELMINPTTTKIYTTYYGHSILSIVNDVKRDQNTLDDSSKIIGMLGAGAIAAIIAFFVIQKKKLKPEQKF